MKIPSKPSYRTETDAQWEAIYAEGTNILVSASAGSGKTYVLTQRVLAKLRQGINIDELLILTFTKKAAREMRERIEKEIRAEIETLTEQQNHELGQHFQKQLHLLSSALITTIDAFCQKIVQEYYYFLPDLSPNYRILSDNLNYEKVILQKQAFNHVMNQYYEKANDLNDTWFYQFVDQFTTNNNDEALLEILNKLIQEASTQADPINYLNNLQKAYLLDQQALKQQNYNLAYQTNFAIQTYILPKWQSFFESLCLMTELDEAVENKELTPKAYESLAKYHDLYYAYQKQNWTELSLAITKLKKPSGAKNLAWVEKYQAKYPFLDFNLLAMLKQDFNETPEEFCQTCQELLPYINQLSELAIAYYHEYLQIKKQHAVFEFSDIEHLAYQILTLKINDSYPVAEFYKQRFAEIMIDEYQDNNALQDAILAQISRGNNLFMVGDIKQSIYGFRKANPMLFKQRYEQYAQEQDGHLIVLQENFRSQSNVLNFTNYIFAQLMDETYGQFTYDELSELKAGTKAQQDDILPTKICVFDQLTQAEMDKIDGQVEMVIDQIQALVESGVEYRQIAMLVKNKSDNLKIKEHFVKHQIPLQISDVNNYFKTTEIQTILALLNIIDNPHQDIPLLAILRSFIVGLTEPEFVNLRKMLLDLDTDEKKLDYYDVLCVISQKKDSLTPWELKIKQFISQLDDFRQKRRFYELSEVIWYLYEQTKYFDYVAGLDNGLQRQANLKALYQYAIKFNEQVENDLATFVKMINTSLRNDEDLNEAVVQTTENAVQLMTIHKSKGLEFDYVFVLGLNKSEKNETDNILCNVVEEVSKIPFGMKYHTIQENEMTLPDLVKKETKIYQILKQQLQLQKYAENMRVLYVALTRAKKQVFLMCQVSEKTHIESWLLNLANDQLVLQNKQHLSPRDGKLNKKMQDWLGLTLIRHPEFYNQVQSLDIYEDNLSPINLNDEAAARLQRLQLFNHVELCWLKEENLKNKVLEEQQMSLAGQKLTKSEIQQILQMFAYQYPYQKATTHASYQAVSEIKQAFADPIIVELSERTVAPNRYHNLQFTKPKFVQQQKEHLSPTERGQMVHRLLQILNLDVEPTYERLWELAVREWDVKRAGQLPLEKIIDFFKTNLGQLMLAEASNVHREQPFSMLLPANHLFNDMTASDDILVHGIIDAYISLPEETILIDYKTNLIKKGQTYNEFIEQMKQQYTGQLRLYKTALQADHQIKKAYLVLLDINQIVEVEL